ncbi:unnamed protein product [Rhizoctonia solani]|uniref:CHAT domain-containing protein n=1 Tax=Rhizoctonia solani TaxID=456999 RepID=A0A8H3E258_9AGAM|nr:unnamed protein product [Rhizoctonia solani]
MEPTVVTESELQGFPPGSNSQEPQEVIAGNLPENVREFDQRGLFEVPDMLQNEQSNNLSHTELYKLGESYRTEFEGKNELGDLEKAIKYTSFALVLTPDSDPSLPLELTTLGISHRDRYQRLGESTDIDKSIEYLSRVCNVTPEGDPYLAYRLTYLGMSYNDRFKHLSDLEDIGKAIEYTSRALTLTSSEDPNRRCQLDNLVLYHNDRFQRLGELNDINKIIDYRCRVLGMSPDGDSNLPYQLAALGICHRDRFQRLGESKDIAKSIEYLSRSLASTPDGDPNLAYRLSLLGISHHDQFQRIGVLSDIEKSIECTSRALALTSSGDSSLRSQLGNLEIYHNARFDHLRQSGELENLGKRIKNTSHAPTLALDSNPSQNLPNRLTIPGTHHNSPSQRKLRRIEMAIEYGSRDLDSTPDSSPTLASKLTRLGISYHQRFQCRGELGDIEKAIEYASRAASLSSRGSNAWLGNNSLEKFQKERSQHLVKLSKLDDIDKRIEDLFHALTLAPNNDPNLPYQLTSLGTLHKDRFQHLGKQDDCEKAIEYISRALDTTPNDDPNLPHRHNLLGLSYNDRFQLLGEPSDIEKSITYTSHALDLTSPDDPNLPNLLTLLGMSYNDRFRKLGEPGDIEKSIETTSRALNLTPDKNPDLLHRLTVLGASHRDRFQRLDELNDINKSIEYLSRAVDSTRDDDPNLPLRLAILGTSYRDRFQRLAEPSDIGQSIEHLSRAVQLGRSRGDSNEARDHANLGVSYRVRFWRLGDLNDITKSSDCMERALELADNGDPMKPHRLNDLGISYDDQFQHLDEPHNIEKSIQYKFEALDLTPNGDPSLPHRLTSLGMSYINRFRHLGTPGNIEISAEYISRALALTPNSDPLLPQQLAGLGLCHGSRFWLFGEPIDLEKAVEHTSRALTLTPEGHPDSSSRHHLLAELRLSQYQLTKNVTNVQYALDSFRKACHSQSVAPRTRLGIAFNWVKHATSYSALDLIEAYQTAINLLPQFFWLSPIPKQRYKDLESAKNLAREAASVAIIGSNPMLALEWLERARCVVWNQSLMLRSPLEQLHSLDSTLANRLQETATQLRNSPSTGGAFSTGFMRGAKIYPDSVKQRYRNQAKEHNDLLNQTRALSGFEEFLRPIKAENLIRAARNGPIVMINCHKDRCDAIIIQPGQEAAHSVPLPNFSHATAQDSWSNIRNSLRRKGIRERGAQLDHESEHEECIGDILKLLWQDIVKPVLDFLGYTSSGPMVELPHITWCLTGALSFLPLHAAGDYDQPHSRAYEYVISSYTPTLTALLSSSPSTLGPGSRVLGVGQEVTSFSGYKLSKLPGTAKELNCIKGHVKNMDKVDYSELIGNKASESVVLGAMETHDWVHLACHAHQNVGDATESGFFLHNGILDLASINQKSFKNKGLAFLSACQTATGDANLPDEAVHLASGMLMAGYTSVIATMWSVHDEDAPLVADKVYGRLMKDGKVGNGEAGKALHAAVEELRSTIGEREFARWVPYIHIGS